MALILVVGDLHGDFEVFHALDDAYRCRADATVLLGDVTAGRDTLHSFAELHREVRTLAIVGNHENWDEVDGLVAGELSVENFEIIVPGKHYRVGGLTLAGLGGNFSPVWSQRTSEDKKAWVEQVRQSQPQRLNSRGDKRKHFTWDQVLAMKRLREAQVLLFHEAVWGQGIRSRTSADSGIAILREVVDEVQPEVCFTSHRHYYRESVIGKTTLYSLPRPREGYLEVQAEEGRIESIRLRPTDTL